MMRKPEVDSYEYVLSVLDKAERGPVIEESVWDNEYISKKAQELIKKYDLSWEKELYIPSDDSLADRLFEASLELARDSGVYCINTKRQMKWTEEELDKALERSPSRLTVGFGDGEHTLVSRKPDGDGRVSILGGAYGTPVQEKYFVQMVAAYAKEPLVDIVETPSLTTAYGYPLRSASPWEAVAAKREAEFVMEAVKLAGRPEGVCVAAAETPGTEIIELAGTSYGLWRQTDWHHASFVAENKVTYADLTRAVHFANTGSIAHTFCDPIYGGYFGGMEGVALGNTSGFILLRAALFGDTMNAGPAHAHISANTHPMLLASQALGIQAMMRNTHMLTSAHIRPAAGPGVVDIFYEVAALAIAAVTSGAAYLKTVQSATGRHMAHTSPLEVRFCAQVAHAVEGMSRKEGNEIVQKLVDMYKDGQEPQQIGKPFYEVYDLKTLEPTDEWLALYDQACQVFKKEFGLDL
jgi:methylamine--corrinoid protein Co-methyltransferase